MSPWLVVAEAGFEPGSQGPCSQVRGTGLLPLMVSRGLPSRRSRYTILCPLAGLATWRPRRPLQGGSGCPQSHILELRAAAGWGLS